MKNKFSKFINLQGKYLTSLLILLALSIGNVWGATTGDLLDLNFTSWYNDGGSTEGNAHYIHAKSSGDYKRSNVAYFTNSAYSKTVPSATNYVCVTCSTSTYNIYAKNNTYLSGEETYSDSYTVSHNSNTTAPTTVVLTLSSPAVIEILAGASSIGNTEATYGYTAPTANATQVQKAYHFLKTYNYSTGSYPLADEIQLKSKDAVVYVTDTTTVAGTTSYSFSAGQLYSTSGGNKKFYIYAIRVTSYSATPATSYTVTINPNEGSYASTPEGWTAGTGVYTKSVASGTALAIPEPSRENYDFNGWKSGTTSVTLSEGKLTVSKDTTLVAQWTSSAATQSNISYTNTKGADNSANPAKYTEGVGVASFEPLADVTDFHFTGWSPSSIAADATGPKVIEAQWVAAYNVTFSAGAGSGTVPASFQKWEGGKFNLPGQGSMTAPAGKAFDGWKANGAGDKLAANAEYTMGNAAVEFVAQWKAVPQTIYSLTVTNTSNVNLNNGGTQNDLSDDATIVGGGAYMQNDHASKAQQILGSTKLQFKAGTVTLAMTLNTALKEGDTIKATGLNSEGLSFGVTFDRAGNLDNQLASDASYFLVPAAFEDSTKLYAWRHSGSGTTCASIQIIRPAAREIASTEITLSDVKVNDHSISSDSLSILKTADAYALTLKDSYADAPVIKFNEYTVITYVEGLPATKETDKVYTVTATVNGEGKWQAQQTINSITYTVTAPKLSSAKVYYYDGATKLGEEVVALNGNPADYADFQSKQLASFVGWYSDADLADGHLISDISALVITADMTVYGKWTYNFATSVNIEKLVMQNGKSYDLMAQMGAQYYASNITGSLDSLSVKADSLRNYSYLGLKVKKSGGLLDFRLAKDNTVKIKFGNVATTPQVSINDGAYAAITITDHVYSYTAEADAYISIKMMDGDAVVFQQIMIGEDIQAPELYPINYADAENGSVSGLKLGIPGETIKLYPTPASGYIVESVTVNEAVITPAENVYSFTMPSAAANIAATFGVYVPPTYTVTYKAGAGSGDDVVDPNEYVEGAEVTLLTPDFTAPASTIFESWASEPVVTISEGKFEMPASDVVLTAQWKSYFTITYKDGDDIIDTENVFTGDAPAGIADPVKAMNIFKGWTLAGSDEVIDVMTLTASTTVYAKWEAIDACFYFAAKSVTADEAITAPANLSNAYGGTIEATDGTFTYTSAGVLIAGGGTKYFTVNLDYALQEGSKIAVKMQAGGASERGLNLRVAGSSSNVYQYKWTPGSEPENQVYDYEYVVPENSPLIGKKVFYLYRNNNVYLQTVTVKDCAPQDYTVTYMDGENALGTEQVYENQNPTAAGINTYKKGYELQGWSLTNGGDVVELTDVTITEDKTLYAKYAVRDCSGMGVKFSMAVDPDKAPASNLYYPETTPAVGDLAVYATVSGGLAQAVNTNTSSTTKNFEVNKEPYFKLTGNGSHMRILLDCPLAENDTIKFVKNQKIVLSFDSLKTKKEDIASSTSFYIVPAKYAGEDTLHIWYDGSAVQVNGVQVIRPEIYAVSFNLMGHGSAIADLTGVIKGSKITAPTAPTDENFAFAGWYKENTLENEWDFANDVVNAATTLYAKWLDKSDATLKSLKYGTTDIELQAGIYEYNVELPALTAAVPALTAVPNSPLAEAVPTDAAAFDGEGHAISTVTVTPAVGAAQIYTVNFSKAAALPQVNVTAATTWNWSLAGSTSMENQHNVVLANVPGITNDNTFNSQALKGTFNKLAVGYFQGSVLSFTTEVDGKLTITFRGTNNNTRHMQVCVGDGETVVADWTYQGSGPSAQQTKSIYVPVGKVTLKAFEGENAQNVRIYNMELSTSDNYHRTVNPSYLGTLCWTNNAVLGGATLYEFAGKNENNYLVFDEVAENRLEAGKPYIFMPENGNTQIKVYNTDNEAALTEDQDPVNNMYGTITGKTLVPGQDDNMYYFSASHIWAVKDFTVEKITVPAYYCYVDYPAVLAGEPAAAPAPGRRRVTMGVQGEQVATGMENINASEQPMKVMIDGQLFILRGEKMFNVNGQLVK